MSDQRPTGFIAWVRRRPLSWASKLAAIAGLGALALWGAGRWFNDDHAWSQFLFWIPTLLVVVFAWTMVLVSSACSRLSLRMGGVMLRPFLALVCLGMTGWMLVGEWRTPRYVLAPGARATDLRVLHWNISVARGARGAGDAVLAQSPDVAMVSNIRNDEFRQPLLDALRTLAPSVDGDGAPKADAYFLRRGGLAVASRFPIRRWGLVGLDPVESRLEEWRSGWDPGRVFFIELDTTGEASIGRPLIVWALDLPSDPTMPRARIMANASVAIGAWDGVSFVPDDVGRWVATAPEAGAFPPPDLVIGDFNAPRGSRSVRAVVGGMTNAFDAAGRGPMGTWPRRTPLWHIDQAFVGELVEATRYRVVDPGLGEHRMQVIDLRAE